MLYILVAEPHSKSNTKVKGIDIGKLDEKSVSIVCLARDNLFEDILT